jgi:FtsZ-binding cell division protein ZapB
MPVSSLPEKPLIEEKQRTVEPDYPESLASQLELDELKEGFEELTDKYKSLAEQLDLVIRERENIPVLLRGMQADLNSQLTMFSDKLYQSLESQMSNPQVSATMTTLDQIKTDQADQYKAAVGFMSDAPKATSPIVQKGTTLKGKKRFKAIK